MQKTAEISACGKYRYLLTREWDNTLPALGFIMLNPSKADADTDDPTIRRCIGFAQRLGYGSIIVGNIYAYRATNPAELKSTLFPIGTYNRQHIDTLLRTAVTVVFAWGTGAAQGDDTSIYLRCRRAGVKPMCLGTTKRGHPMHPLYLPADSPLVQFYF